MSSNTNSKNFTGAYCLVYLYATSLLERYGEAALGDLVTALRTGTEDVYEGFDERIPASIGGLTELEIQGLYESVLERLERERGPLWTFAPEDPKGRAWGYAGPYDPRASLPTIEAPLVDKRFGAFHNGHPDAYRCFEDGSLPPTTWYCLKVALAA